MDMGSGQVFDFGLRLRKLRENKHLSQEELGKRVGVTKGSIYRYENNVQSPSLETARKLAVVLGTTLDNLAGSGGWSRHPASQSVRSGRSCPA